VREKISMNKTNPIPPGRQKIMKSVQCSNSVMEGTQEKRNIEMRRESIPNHRENTPTLPSWILLNASLVESEKHYRA
jgi:hypothetical protein